MPPAARVGDMHVCPMVTGAAVPHVGGPILPPGAPTVLIAGMPAARVGDMCTCVGPPDTIVMGSTKVMIGGKPAARMGDPTAHGGVDRARRADRDDQLTTLDQRPAARARGGPVKVVPGWARRLRTGPGEIARAPASPLPPSRHPPARVARRGPSTPVTGASSRATIAA